MKSYIAKKGEVDRKWVLIDADGQILGRLATKIASILMGKTKPVYTPHVDTGDFVVVVNAEKIRLTGKKAQTKQYQRYTGYPGGQKIVSYAEMLDKKPERVIELAVRRINRGRFQDMAEQEKEDVITNPDMVIEQPPAAETSEKEKEKEAEKPARRTVALTGTPDKGGFIWGTGRRKSAVARVRIKPGDGKLLINKRTVASPSMCSSMSAEAERPDRPAPSDSESQGRFAITTPTSSRSSATADTSHATGEWSNAKNPGKEAQGEGSSSRNVKWIFDSSTPHNARRGKA